MTVLSAGKHFLIIGGPHAERGDLRYVSVSRVIRCDLESHIWLLEDAHEHRELKSTFHCIFYAEKEGHVPLAR